MKIVISALGTLGDLRPAMVLAREYQNMGHHITLVCTQDFLPLARDFGLSARGIPVDFQGMAKKNASLMGRPARAAIPLLGNLKLLMQKQRPILQDALEGAQGLICWGIQLETASFGEWAGIPHVHLLHSPNWLEESRCNPPLYSRSVDRSAKVHRHWRFFKGLLNWGFRREINQFRSELGLSQVQDIYHWASSCLKVLYPRDLAGLRSSRVVDWYPPVEPHSLSPELQAFLEAYPNPVYLGFGSMPGSTEKLESMVKGICRELNRGLIIQGNIPGKDDPPGIFRGSHLPHGSLFPRMGLIIHHAGAGTFFQAGRAGVPQLVIPQLLDQFYWARRAWDLGLAPWGTYWNKIRPKNLKDWIQTGLAMKPPSLWKRDLEKYREPPSPWDILNLEEPPK